MQSINIYEKGIAYLGAVMSVYGENCAYFLLYLLGLIYILIKGDEKEKDIFIPSSIILFLTVYNPVVPFALNKFFDVNSEYYRLFWIAPVIVLVAYVLTKILTTDIAEKCTNEKVWLVAIIILVILCAGNFVYRDGYNRIQNIYQVPDELIEISEMIHEDSEYEYPKAFLEYEYNMQMRQYDPKMQLTIDREDYLRAVTENYSQEMIEDNEHPQYRILASLLRGQNVETNSLIDALETTKTEYVVLSKGNTVCEKLEEAGLATIGETASHVIYRYDVKEPYIYELVDYSDAEHRIGFRRLK